MPPALPAFVLETLGFCLHSSTSDADSMRDLGHTQRGTAVARRLPFNSGPLRSLFQRRSKNRLAGSQSQKRNGGNSSAKGLGAFGSFSRPFANSETKAHHLFAHSLGPVAPEAKGSSSETEPA